MTFVWRVHSEQKIVFEVYSTKGLWKTMPVELRQVQVASEYDHDGRLILIDGWLVAVVVKLSEFHEQLAGHWYLETGYGVLRGEQPTFSDLNSAVEWIQDRLKHSSLISRPVAS